MLTDSVSMIPFALLSGIVCSGDHEKLEIRILEAAKDGFHFRTAEELNNVSSITLYFYNQMEQLYRKVDVPEPTAHEIERDDYSVTYEVTVESDEYVSAVGDLLTQYYSYIELKLDGDDAKLSKVYNGYLAELDGVITTDFTRQKRKWCEGASQIDDAELNQLSHLEFALELDNQSICSKYINNSFNTFVKMYWEEHELCKGWISKCKISRLYIGNQFCHNLFPHIDSLIEMLNKAKKEDVNVTVVFTYLREELIESTANTLDKLYQWCRTNDFSVEIVVNDWGMLSLLSGREDRFTLVMGVLLNKRRKDPRMKYMLKSWKNEQQVELNAVNSAFFQNFLENEYNICRYEFESCGYKQKLPRGRHSLHIPFYQTNTSQYCVLYARCREQCH